MPRQVRAEGGKKGRQQYIIDRMEANGFITEEQANAARAETLKLREMEYIQAAQAFGVSSFRILTRHIVPNVMHIVLISVVPIGFEFLRERAKTRRGEAGAGNGTAPEAVAGAGIGTGAGVGAGAGNVGGREIRSGTDGRNVNGHGVALGNALVVESRVDRSNNAERFGGDLLCRSEKGRRECRQGIGHRKMTPVALVRG